MGFRIVAGGILVAVVFVGLFEDTPTTMETASMAAYAILMMCVCMLACVIPTRRALLIQPASVLKIES